MTLAEPLLAPEGGARLPALELFFRHALDLMAQDLPVFQDDASRSGKVRARTMDVTEASRIFNRPLQAMRFCLLGPEGQSLDLAILLGEQDGGSEGAVPPRGGGAEPVFDALAASFCQALYDRTRRPWRPQAQPHLGGHLVLLSEMDRVRLEVVSCWLDGSRGVNQEMTFVMPSGTNARLARWEEDVVVALRPGLSEVETAPGPPGAEMDPVIMGAIPVEMRALLAAAPVTVGELARLRGGDVLRLEHGWDRMVDVVVGGRRVARGELLLVDGRWGVLVQDVGVQPRANALH